MLILGILVILMTLSVIWLICHDCSRMERWLEERSEDYDQEMRFKEEEEES